MNEEVLGRLISQALNDEESRLTQVGGPTLGLDRGSRVEERTLHTSRKKTLLFASRVR